MRRAITAVAVAAVLFTATCGGHQRNGARDTALTAANSELSTHNSKLASIIPAGVRLIAREAGIALSAGGYTLSWKYENPGDYAQEGKVGVEDLTPIAQHFGEVVSPENEWIKVSEGGTQVIGVADITPIAMNLGSEVTGYRIDGAPSTNGPWNEVALAELVDGDGTNGRLAFSSEIAPGFIYYRIVTLTPDGDAAFSNTLIAPSNEPIIYSVTPTSGYQHEGYTFSATASGQEPLTYAWDFGGGATPDNSSDISPTVTLSDAGEYSATLTISNSYGPTTFPFTLSVSARDTWAHTWGGNSGESGVDVAVGLDESIYVLGYTCSFSAGEQDSLVVKYAPNGEVIWARTWGGTGNEAPRGIAVLSDGNIIAGGNTTSFGAGLDDIYLLKYDTGGALIRQMTWGSSDRERFNRLVVDGQDNVFIIGSWLNSVGAKDGLIVKFNDLGSVQWATQCDSGTDDYFLDICLDETYAYVCGFLEITGKGREASLIKFAPNGALEWAETIGGQGEDRFDGVTIHKGQIIACGFTTSYGDSLGDILLATVNADESIDSVITWGGERKQQAYSISADTDYGISIVGASQAASGSLRGLVLRADGDIITAKSTINGDLRLNCLAFSSDGDLYLAGNSISSLLIWESLEGIKTEQSSPALVLSFSTQPIAGEVWDAEGTTSSPEGITDFEDGVSRLLVVKN